LRFKATKKKKRGIFFPKKKSPFPNRDPKKGGKTGWKTKKTFLS